MFALYNYEDLNTNKRTLYAITSIKTENSRTLYDALAALDRRGKESNEPLL